MANNLEYWTGVQEISWTKVLQNEHLSFGSHYKVVPTEGYIAWEYNPLRNYRLSHNMYEKDGKYYEKSEFIALVEAKGYIFDSSINKFKQIVTNEDGTQKEVVLQDIPDNWTLKEAGELVDFITNELSFDIKHPVELLPQYSYDGSINLILNDGLNIPRLINSRFTVTGKNTYKVIDRKGDNDTNIYDQGDQFDIDTSLFKNVNKIPKLTYLGTSNGNVKIGNYHFYFKYADADGNESDWVAESGLVSIFLGDSPISVNTGIRDENSNKSIRFRLTNIDIGYSYVKVYYTRYSADVDSNLIVQAVRIDKKFLVNNSGNCVIVINGDEDETEVTLEEINSSFDVIQTAQTQCSASNRLFMANIHKSKIEYDMLSKLSLCFCPYKHEEPYPLINDGMNETYDISANSDGYYDTSYIYNKTGYWPGELYRFGVVYILKDGSLSPVFNIRGATNVSLDSDPIYKIEQDIIKNKPTTVKDLEKILQEIDYSEEDYMIVGGKANNENAKGVVQFVPEINTSNSPFPVVGLKIKANKLVIKKLKEYIKGFFFVRQKRIPITMCQGIVVGLDSESRTPTIPVLGGILSDFNLENSFVESADINDINYLSEGFLGRYHFSINPIKTKTGVKVLKVLGVVAILAAAVVATIFTCGAAGVAIGAGIAAMATAGGALVASSIATVGIVAGAAITTGVTVVGIQHASMKARQKRNKGVAKAIKGRSEEIPLGYERKETEESRKLIQDLEERYIIKDPSKNNPEAIIVPDYQVNEPYYNQLLTGQDFTVKLTHEQSSTNFLTDGYFDNNQRHFYVSNYTLQNDNRIYPVKLVGVPDGCPIKMIGESKYRARAGYAEEAYKYEFQGVTYEDSVNKRDNSDIIRGNYGSYVGMYGYKGHACDQVDIMIPGYKENNLFEYVQLRASDTSAFYAISDRIDINDLNQRDTLLAESNLEEEDFKEIYYRGDSYICQFTHRIIRNFNDPAAPYNDKIVDPNTWRDNYNLDKPEQLSEINLGDVNAVQLGLWLTFQLRSSYNLNIRTIDKSNVDEYLMCGNYRSFYPNYGQLADGNQKIPDSNQYNKGFSKSVSEKYYFEVPDIPYIKQEFQNRIVFSDIHINDAYKNGFRVIRTTNHKDYPMTYGSITKILEMKNALLLVFEHGIGLVSINNQAEHSSQILSDLNIISDTYGSQWKDSIIKTPSGIYGVDTVAKKIWRVREGQIELISDMKVQEFLNNNITLSERELTPIIGVRNIKTLYNSYKHDIMFTFYDNLHGIHEKSWNLCYNEILGIFTTFYSWIPSEMPSIDNIPFSFDRTTVKAIGKLGISDHGNDFSDGVTLSNNVITNINQIDQTFSVRNRDLVITYLNKFGEEEEYKFKTSIPEDDAYKDTVLISKIKQDPKFIGFLHLDNRILFDEKSNYSIEYELLRDIQGNHNLFEIKHENVAVDLCNQLLADNVAFVKVGYLRLRDKAKVSDLLSEIYYRNAEGHSYADVDSNKLDTYIRNDSKEIIGRIIHTNKPIFKNSAGKRLNLPENDKINPDKIVRYLNIKAKVSIIQSGPARTAQDAYYNQFANGSQNICMIDAGYFESQVAVTTDFNLSLLSGDFWKHGQAGLIDISDKIYPTYWYGKQHPFEFECVVVDDPSVHKIFTNLELVANKVKPESFHYEVVGDTYDFAEDKPTMYFRQEALKALYQYNGYDIEYNPNFLNIEPKQHNRSADLPKYYSRWDTVNDIYDSYKRFQAPIGFNYDHLAGAEIVYYPTRNEFRVWNHVEAIDADAKVLNKKGMEVETSIIKANCRYLEDKWLVSINPIIVTYKNEIDKSIVESGNSIFSKNFYGVYKYSTWVKAAEDGPFAGSKLPPINIQGTKLEEKLGGNIEIPQGNNGKDNALYGLYDLDLWNQGDWRPIDPTKNKDRRETDVRGKFMKVRIRYSGEELAIIDFLNTIYQISFA